MTPWNVAHLRQLVLAGAESHPGAVAVEDEQGRIISLAGARSNALSVFLCLLHVNGRLVSAWRVRVARQRE